MQIFGSIGWLLGYILWGAFFIFKNFGIAIIVFTIIVKAALFPFTLKQQKSMAGSARMAKRKNKKSFVKSTATTVRSFRRK